MIDAAGCDVDLNEVLLQHILRIVQQRKFCDDQARTLAKYTLVDSAIEYVENVFQHAIDIGRLAPKPV
jgi:hypothetical protein